MSDDNYEKICKDRFGKLEEGQEAIKKDVQVVREKIFNGLSDSIQHVTDELKSLRVWVLGLIGTVGLSLIVTMIKMIWFS